MTLRIIMIIICSLWQKSMPRYLDHRIGLKPRSFHYEHRTFVAWGCQNMLKNTKQFKLVTSSMYWFSLVTHKNRNLAYFLSYLIFTLDVCTNASFSSGQAVILEHVCLSQILFSEHKFEISWSMRRANIASSQCFLSMICRQTTWSADSKDDWNSSLWSYLLAYNLSK